MGYSITNLSKGQPQREQARELCLGGSYGYSEMCVLPWEQLLSQDLLKGIGEEIPVP